MYSPIDEVHDEDDAANRASPREQRQRVAIRVLWWISVIVAFVACLIFGIYIACFYLRSLLVDKWNSWDLTNPGMFHKDRWDSNIMMGIHLIGAAYLMLLGPLQFVPAIRRRYLKFHRWNGRLGVISCLLTGIGGIYYIGAVGLTFAPMVGQRANIVNVFFGLAAILCGIEMYRHAAYTKKIDQHKRWAYRAAGIFLGNIYARLYLVTIFLVLGLERPEDPKHDIPFQVAMNGLLVTFFVPFLWLADVAWHREESKTPAVSTLWIILGYLVLFCVVGLLVLQATFLWLPYLTINLDDVTDMDDE